MDSLCSEGNRIPEPESAESLAAVDDAGSETVLSQSRLNTAPRPTSHLIRNLFIFSLLLIVSILLPYHGHQFLPSDAILHTKVKVVSFTVDFIFSMCGIAGVEEPGTTFNRKLFELINPRISESYPAFSGHVRTRDIALEHFVGNESVAKDNSRLINTEELEIKDSLKVRVFEPNARFYQFEGAKIPLMIFFHGGGFVLQHVWDLEQNRVCRKFARYGPMIVIAVEYRLAPEHPYPANIEDMKFVIDWLARERNYYRTSYEYNERLENRTAPHVSSEDERYISNYDDDHLSHVPYSLVERLKALLTGSVEEYRGNIRNAEAWRYYIPQNIDWDKIILGGDSAGGQLAASAALYVKEEYPEILPFIKQQILIYPTFALVNTESKRIYANSPVLNEGVMRFFIHAYSGFNESLIFDRILRDPYVNPMLSPSGLEELPPAFFVIAGLDPLQDDSKIYARQLQKAGVPVRVLFYPLLSHGFFTMSLFSESEMAMHQVLDHMRKNKILL